MSLACSVTGALESSAAVSVPFVATGGSFTGVTVTLMVAVLELSWPSLARNVKESAPL